MKTSFIGLLISSIIITAIISSNFYFPANYINHIDLSLIAQNIESYRFEDPKIAYQILQQVDIFGHTNQQSSHKTFTKYHKQLDDLKRDHDYCINHKASSIDYPEFAFHEKNDFVDHPLSDIVHEVVKDYAKRYHDKPQCFNSDKLFPKTWLLRHEDQCRDFFENYFKGEAYENLKQERIIVYMKKVIGDSSKELQQVDKTEEAILRKIFEDGALCGKVKKNILIQTRIYNPLLLQGHKFDLRIYVLVVSKDPLIVYYHDGFLRVAFQPSKINSKDKSGLLTSTSLSNKIEAIRAPSYSQGLNKTELRNIATWNFQTLNGYFLQHNLTYDYNWINDHLRPEFQKAMIHLIRMTKSSFLGRNSMYELFACDFIMDKGLNIRFLECNPGLMLPRSLKEKKQLSKWQKAQFDEVVTGVLKDEYEIISGLLKSRMKRVFTYINTIIKGDEYEKLASGEIIAKDLEIKKRAFKEIIKNNFEPEFKTGSENGFVRIIDENFYGTERFSGLISKECLFEEDIKKEESI